jgi:23S rRNA (guanosine2251-2'-O)-methyltransferase
MSNHKRRITQNESGRKSCWLYGVHAVAAALANEARSLRVLLATPQAATQFESRAKTREVTLQIKSAPDIARVLPEGAVHQGVALEAAPLIAPSLEQFLDEQTQRRPLLLLDQVTDPQNVGAILRSAAAFEAGAVILPRDHAPLDSPVLAKAACGALELVPLIAVTNLAQAMKTLKAQGYWCVGLEGEAERTIEDAGFGVETALVLGAEGSGLRRLTREHCDLLVRLPISARMESLNVSNAAAIALYAVARNLPK